MRRLRRFSLLVLSSVLISALLVTSFPILGASIDPGGSGSATSVVYADDYGELAGTVVINSVGAGTVSGVYYGELTSSTTLHVTSINSDIVLQTHHQILFENRDEWGQVVATGFKFQSGFGSPAIPPGRWRVCVRQGGSYNPCSRVFTVGSDGTVVPDEPVVDEPPPKPALSARFIVSPAVPMVGEPIIFTSVSECYGGAEIKGYNWTLNGKSIANIDPSYVDKVSWVWPAPTEGACTVTLFIYTDSGLRDECTQKFWVNAITAWFEIDQKSGQEITFTSTSSPEESITEYHWRIDGHPDAYHRAEDKKSWTYRFEPGTHEVSLCVVGASGQDTYTKEFTVAPVHLHIYIASKADPIQITDQPQHVVIKLVVRQFDSLERKLVPYEGAEVNYTVAVEPGKYQDFCALNIVPYNQIRSTDQRGVAEYQRDITNLLSTASEKGIDPQTFAAEIEINASARSRSEAGEPDWHLEATETIHVGGVRPMEVKVFLLKDDEKIQTRFNDYSDRACLCKECRESTTSDPSEAYKKYEVPLTGTVTSDYLPITMTLKMRQSSSQLAIDGKEKKEVTLGQLPGIQETSYNFSIRPRVSLDSTGDVRILLYQDMATEAVAQALRMVFQAVGGEKFEAAATLGTLFYDIVNKVRINAATGTQQVSGWDFLGLALTEIGEQQGKIAATMGNMGKKFAAIPFTAVGMAYDSGVWAWSLYNTPAVAEEIWRVDLREAKL